LHRFAKFPDKYRTLLLFFPGLVILGACADEQIPPPPPASAAAEAAPSCGAEGFLSTTLFGTIERELAWRGGEFECENMRRPDGQGMRLRFTGDAADRAIAIILAMPGLEPGQDGSELPTVVTFTVEGSGRFFSTADLDSCFTDIEMRPLDDEAGKLFEARGTLYCVTPLGEINGDAALSIPELEFHTRMDWDINDS
jgi:hypothetical protein